MFLRRKKIGLALGGGGSRGIAHLGILKVFEDNNLKPDIIVGTSFGSIVGAAYATGKYTVPELIDEFESVIYSNEFKAMGLDVVGGQQGENNINFIKKLKSSINKIMFYNKLLNSKYIVENEKLMSVLKLILPDINIEDLPVKFAVVSLDLVTKTSYVFEKGPLLKAVLASSCIPGIFEPVKIKGRLLIDGGWIIKVPVPVARELGADKVIAVDVSNPPKKRVEYKSGLDMMFLADRINQELLKELQILNSDLIIRPMHKKINWYNFHQYRRIIRYGEDAAKKHLLQIKKVFKRRRIF